MLSKKKKIVILVGMLALFIVTGYLNIMLNSKANQPTLGGNIVYENFFVSYRADRIETRNQTTIFLDEIIQNASSSAEAKKEAETKKLMIADRMETELALEALIKALGFEDVVVTNTSANINVIVKAAALDELQVTKIEDIIASETSQDLQFVKIFPVE